MKFYSKMKAAQEAADTYDIPMVVIRYRNGACEVVSPVEAARKVAAGTGYVQIYQNAIAVANDARAARAARRAQAAQDAEDLYGAGAGAAFR